MHVYISGKENQQLNNVHDAEIQNVQSARMYVFGNDDQQLEEFGGGNSGEQTTSNEMCELRPRKAGAVYKNGELTKVENGDVECVEREIKDGETLHSIALRYGCPVSELKRFNNFIQDQDFFGRKYIKVPVKKHGLLTQILAQEKIDETKDRANVIDISDDNGGAIESFGAYGGGRRNRDEVCDDDDYYDGDENSDDDDATRQLLVRTLSIRDSYGGGARSGQQTLEAREFLKHMDKDLENIRNMTVSQKSSLEEVANTLTCRRIYPMPQRRWFFNGADCGMRWWSVVLIMLVIGLLTPLFVFLYIQYWKPPD
ncbi:lysM and putative peptidoglycan-binding domain-containing protein 3-like [Tubulanus polymorphus]|uniref:lysM and putative peptidoglycan-binding domain-containing protein 3-like n=1 Tax=Tubulanus polymorphus TaxID=672921 RepID=UPI003DA39C41